MTTAEAILGSMGVLLVVVACAFGGLAKTVDLYWLSPMCAALFGGFALLVIADRIHRTGRAW